MDIFEHIDKQERREDIPDFSPGDTVRLLIRTDSSGRRAQPFEGVVIRRKGSGSRETFTVRKISHGVGVERTFPVHSPSLEKIEVLRRGDVNRAKLYYLRERVGKKARVKEKRGKRPGMEKEVVTAEEMEKGVYTEAPEAEAAAESDTADEETAEVQSEENYEENKNE